MAYNYKSIEVFIERVNKEAEAAAQKIYDKYEQELLKKVQAQIKEGDTVRIGMGTSLILNRQGERVGNNLQYTIAQIHYWQNNICAGMSLPYKFTKTETIEKY